MRVELVELYFAAFSNSCREMDPSRPHGADPPALHSPHAPVLGLPQLLVPPQHLQDQLLLVLGQEAQVDGLCSLRHGAWKGEPSAWVTCVQSLPREALRKLRIFPLNI